MNKIYVFDIDNTICTETKGKYKRALPLINRIQKINKLYDEEHTIILFTARGGSTGIDWSKLTKEQLKRWGVKYHQLIFGKLNYDKWIDDKAENANDFFK